MSTETLNFLSHQTLNSGTYTSPIYTVPDGTISLEVGITVDSSSNSSYTLTQLQSASDPNGPWDTGANIQSFGNTGANGGATYGGPNNPLPLPAYLRTVTTVGRNQGGGTINTTMQVTVIRTF
jgi:hypothetical protein